MMTFALDESWTIVLVTKNFNEFNMTRKNMAAARKIANEKSLRETIYERIRDDITFGKLYPG